MEKFISHTRDRERKRKRGRKRIIKKQTLPHTRPNNINLILPTIILIYYFTFFIILWYRHNQCITKVPIFFGCLQRTADILTNAVMYFVHTRKAKKKLCIWSNKTKIICFENASNELQVLMYKQLKHEGKKKFFFGVGCCRKINLVVNCVMVSKEPWKVIVFVGWLFLSFTHKQM